MLMNSKLICLLGNLEAVNALFLWMQRTRNTLVWRTHRRGQDDVCREGGCTTRRSYFSQIIPKVIVADAGLYWLLNDVWLGGCEHYLSLRDLYSFQTISIEKLQMRASTGS
jgi:hypothetical protein